LIPSLGHSPLSLIDLRSSLTGGLRLRGGLSGLSDGLRGLLQRGLRGSRIALT